MIRRTRHKWPRPGWLSHFKLQLGSNLGSELIQTLWCKTDLQTRLQLTCCKLLTDLLAQRLHPLGPLLKTTFRLSGPEGPVL